MRFRNWLIAAIFSIISFQTFSQLEYVSNDTMSFAKLMFVGDLPMDKRLLESIYNSDIDEYEFQQLFHYIRPILNLGDIVVGNLESTIGKNNFANYPLYKSPENFAKALKYAGFNVLMTANGKTVHQNIEDWKFQRNALKKVGIEQIGSFENEDDRYRRNPLMIEKKGIKVALLNYMDGIDFFPEVSPIINAAKEDIIKQDVALAKARGADFVVVYFHWGREFQPTPNVIQQNLGDIATMAGADLVIGNHPHLVQLISEVDRLEGGKVKQSIIAYSLGDFYTTVVSHDVNGSLILEVIIGKSKKTLETEVVDFGFISTYTQTFTKNDRPTWSILPVSEIVKGNITAPITQDHINKMAKSSGRTRNKLANMADEVQYELTDEIIADVEEILRVTRRPLNESKDFRLDRKEKLLAFSGFLDEGKIETTVPEQVATRNVEMDEKKEGVDNATYIKKEKTESTSDKKPISQPEVLTEIKGAEGEVVYKVQFMALNKVKPIDTKYYKHLEGYEVLYEEGFYKYLIGETNSLKQINDLCLDVKRLGHKNAFVVAYKNGKRIKF